METRESKEATVVQTNVTPDEFLANNPRFVFFDEENGEYTYLQHPYLSNSFEVEYSDDPFLTDAAAAADDLSLDSNHPTGAVIVVDGVVVARAANGSTYHEEHECERVKRGIPTGQGYELCEGCHPKNHAEVSAVKDLRGKLDDDALETFRNAQTTLYLHGHWWLCEYCSRTMEEVGITRAVLAREWVRKFLEI